jgi:hypothetical protein
MRAIECVLDGGGNQVASSKVAPAGAELYYEGCLFKQLTKGQPAGISYGGTALMIGQSADKAGTENTLSVAYVRFSQFAMGDSGPIIHVSNVQKTYIHDNTFQPNGTGAATVIIRCDMVNENGSTDIIMHPSTELVDIRRNTIAQANYRWVYGKYWRSPATVIYFENNTVVGGGKVARVTSAEGGFGTGADWANVSPTISLGPNPGFA